MEQYVVSARKYRPATFDTVVGQQHITTTLKNAIRSGQLAQAFLFCGPRGVGKTTCARILAKTINCRNLTPEAEACGNCESCIAFQQSASFNIHELDAASNNSVDDIRNLVDQVRYAPQSGKYKIYIIDEVHMLSNAAFNAFLKTLEEPPSYAIFILATTEKHKIIPTILSRCQIFDFNRIQLSDISGHLAGIASREGIQAEAEALELIARKADGGLRDALSMFDMLVTFSPDRSLSYRSAAENLHILDYDYYFQVTDALLEEQAGAVLLLFNQILKKGFDGHHFIGGLSEHLRNLLVCKDAQTLVLLEVWEGTRQKYLQQSKKASTAFLLSALNLSGQCDLQYKQSHNQRLLVELCLLKMAHLQAAFQLHQENGAGEKKNTNENGLSQKNEKEAALSQALEVNSQKVSAVPIAFRPTVKLNAQVKEPDKLQVNDTDKPVDKPQAYIQLSEPFDPRQAEQVVEELIRQLKAQDRMTEVLMLSKPFVLEDKLFHFTLDSQTLLQRFNQEFKPELTDFLRTHLRNTQITVQAGVAEIIDTKRSLYSVDERFKYLLDKYPQLTQLKDKLNLEPG
jgi:DNA polymerase-3 subunit gamma/tau